MIVEDGDRPKMLVAAALLLVVLAFYSRSTGFGLTQWDDARFILQNPLLTGGWTGLRQIWQPGGVQGEALYIPLTYTSFWLEHGLAGFSPWLFHFDSVLLHALNVLLVFALVLRVERRLWVAGAAALLFALHPLQVEAVCWAMGRKDVLSSALLLAGLLASLPKSGRLSIRRILLVLFLFLAAALAKPSVLVFPGFLLLLHWRRWRQPQVWGMVTAASVISLCVLFLNQGGLGQVQGPGFWARFPYLPAMGTGWLRRLALLSPPRALYLTKTLMTSAHLSWAQLLPCLTLLVLFGWACWKRWWRVVALSVAFLLAFLPALRVALFPMRDFFTADRYGYFALIPFSWLLAAGIDAIPAGRRHQAGQVLFLCFVVLAAGLAWQRQDAWRSDLTLWQQEVKLDPDNYIAELKLGNARETLGDRVGAARAYQRSISLCFSYAEAHNNLGRLYQLMKNWSAALREYNHAVSLQPDNARALMNRGLFYLIRNHPRAALRDTRRSLALAPDQADAWYNLGMIHEKLMAKDKAEKAYRQALSRRPVFPAASYNLALLLAQSGRTRAAVAAFRAVVRAQPGHAFAWYNLAVALHKLKKDAEAEKCRRRYQALRTSTPLPHSVPLQAP